MKHTLNLKIKVDKNFIDKYNQKNIVEIEDEDNELNSIKITENSQNISIDDIISIPVKGLIEKNKIVYFQNGELVILNKSNTSNSVLNIVEKIDFIIDFLITSRELTQKGIAGLLKKDEDTIINWRKAKNKDNYNEKKYYENLKEVCKSFGLSYNLLASDLSRSQIIELLNTNEFNSLAKETKNQGFLSFSKFLNEARNKTIEELTYSLESVWKYYIPGDYPKNNMLDKIDEKTSLMIEKTRFSTVFAFKSDNNVLILNREEHNNENENNKVMVKNRVYDLFGAVKFNNGSLVNKLPTEFFTKTKVNHISFTPSFVYERNVDINKNIDEVAIMYLFIIEVNYKDMELAIRTIEKRNDTTIDFSKSLEIGVIEGSEIFIPEKITPKYMTDKLRCLLHEISYERNNKIFNPSTKHDKKEFYNI